MKKSLLYSIFLLNFIVVNAQHSDVTTQSEPIKQPYKLIIPKGWTTEQFPIPIGFAPEIPYVGTEDIRFAPRWSDASSDEYWTYAFLWFLDGDQNIDAGTIEHHLQSYYTGLIKVNNDHNENTKVSIVTTSFILKKSTNNDQKTFSGTIEMDDYKNGKPITLHCIVHVRSCLNEDKTAIFFELSPKSFHDNLWVTLEDIWLNFSCW